MGSAFKDIRTSRIQKSAEEAAVLRRLREFLDKEEPGLVYLLVNFWRNQGMAITYKELREAILNGAITAELFLEWQQDYSNFVTEYLLPLWEAAMAYAAAETEKKYPLWRYDPYGKGVKKWVYEHGAEFVTNSTSTQIQGLQALIKRAAVLEDMTVDQLSRAIRPMVGLTLQQAQANLRYYETLIKNGTSERKAQDLSYRYAARQHRQRAYNIARTELAFAYCKGADEGVRQAQAAGYMGEVVKIWCTADDERTCKVCGALEGKAIAMDEDFDFQTRLVAMNPEIRRTPPAHVSCRCGVIYKEIRPPRR